jgi:hypothetical protein
MVCWVGPQRRADDGSARRQRAPSPPDVQGGYVALPNVLLAARMFRDAFDGQIDFDEALRELRRHEAVA